jgi:hypothetical protein
MVAIAAVCGVGIEPENFLMAGPLVAHPLAFLTTLITLSQHSWLDQEHWKGEYYAIFVVFCVQI